MKARWAMLLPIVLSSVVAGCGDSPPPVLGTLEWDRISVPAPAPEPIIEVAVAEGAAVEAGQMLLQLDATRAAARLKAAEAEVERLAHKLALLEAGPRIEQLHQAEASLAGAQSRARQARSEYQRVAKLVERKLLAQAALDKARATRDSAVSAVDAARARLVELQHGTRDEQLAQARAARESAKARAKIARVDLARLRIEAPRDGVVDSLPFVLGDQAPVGAPLVLLLVRNTPYARVYVPETIRARVTAGDPVEIHVDGRAQAVSGVVRSIRNEPSFTPYFALSGEDASRLSYVAEIRLTGEEAQKLPAGLPVKASFPKIEQSQQGESDG